MRNLLLAVLCLLISACAAPHSFVLLDQTAVDQTTGLVWAKHANLPGKQLFWKGDGNVYEFIQKLNKDNYAGYADWRVPTKDELADLIGHAKSFGYDPANRETWPFQKLRLQGFQDVRDYGYWSSTRKSPTELWIADLAYGSVKPALDTKPYYLWPVRGGRNR
ncbi:DUF1566 domain-containing protein [Geobacter sp. DSM 9736]|uniref:Lcl C-terminal domain-containing protein n=1 Tax=Geobacter sp. DSM 9736 TaxID=1277350 RepID=UPI000B50056C|nr:DUF1566 domain-containing protein [Geobacter sp. DSM 9736]SNB47540.1 Protein of unknown function [Geobacter sp. DSM 9736]